MFLSRTGNAGDRGHRCWCTALSTYTNGGNEVLTAGIHVSANFSELIMALGSLVLRVLRYRLLYNDLDHWILQTE